MFRTSIAILFILLSLSAIKAHKPVLDVQFYGIEEGLSNRDVQCVHQDKSGFLWLGTRLGLNRFDGYNFKWFTKVDGQLPFVEVNDILADREGNMWLIESETFDHAEIISVTGFDPVSETLISLDSLTNGPIPFNMNEIINYGSAEDHCLYFLSKSNILYLYRDNWSQIQLDIQDPVFPDALHFDDNQNTWLIYNRSRVDRRIYVFDPGGNQLYYKDHSKASYIEFLYLDSLGYGHYVEIIQDIDNEEIYREYTLSKTGDLIDLDRIRFFEKNKLDMNFYLEGDIFHYRDYTVLSFEPDFHLLHQDSEHAFLNLAADYPHFSTTNALLEDDQGYLWLGTQFGLYRLSIKTSFFSNQFSYMGDPEKELFACRKIDISPAGNAWIRTETPSSVYIYDPSAGHEISIQEHSGFNPLIPNKFKSDAALLFSSNGLLYIANGGEVIQYDPIKKSVNIIDTGFPYRSVWTLYEDQRNRIWFHDQLNNRFGIIQNNRVRDVPVVLDPSQRLYVYQFFELNKDTVLLATNGGIFSFDLSREQLLGRYWDKGEEEHYFPYNIIFHIYQDESLDLWLSTKGQGIVQIDFKEDGIEVLNHYTIKDGLSNNTVYAMYPDQEGNLWMSTDFGISQFFRNAESFRRFSMNDGLDQYEFNRVSHAQDASGRIYFGGLHGITSFDPNALLDPSARRTNRLIVTALESLSRQTGEISDKLAFFREQNTIVFAREDLYYNLSFSNLSFEPEDNIRYAYKIENINNDWIYQKENSIRLGRLPYGRYSLLLKAQSGEGSWSEIPVSIDLIYIKPLILRPWFIILLGFTFVGATILLFRLRLNALKRRKEELELLVEQRTRQIQRDKQIIKEQANELKTLEMLKSRFFANISHELKTPLSLMLGPVGSLKKRFGAASEEQKLLDFIHTNAKKLLSFVNEILDISRLEKGIIAVHSESFELKAFLDNLCQQFQVNVHPAGPRIISSFDLDPQLSIRIDKGKLEKILSNFLSNALKYSAPESKIEVRSKVLPDLLRISVTDQGPGIPEEDLPFIFDRFYQSGNPDIRNGGGSGIGLAFSKELAELLGVEVWAENVPGNGARFNLDLDRSFVVPDNSVTKKSRQSASSKAGKKVLIDHPEKSQISQSTKQNKDYHILLVEDNAELRNYMGLILHDFTFHAVANGQIALDYLHSKKGKDTDLIISDLMMPVMDGFQLLEKIKSEDQLRHLPVIMLTAKTNIETRLKALRAGIDDYMSKPFDEDELKIRVKNLLHNYTERLNYHKEHIYAESANGFTEELVPDNLISREDSDWLESLEDFLHNHLSDNRLTIDFAANAFNISERQFYRKLKRLTGMTPNKYIQEIRLQKARSILQKEELGTLKELSSRIGFSDVSYFTKLFVARFGVHPSGMLNR
jgi:signal transduction histidine kinase/DNA-binding response OmpR family regulator/ligand-binding sensor domain-containing protein